MADIASPATLEPNTIEPETFFYILTHNRCAKFYNFLASIAYILNFIFTTQIITEKATNASTAVIKLQSTLFIFSISIHIAAIILHILGFFNQFQQSPIQFRLFPAIILVFSTIEIVFFMAFVNPGVGMACSSPLIFSIGTTYCNEKMRIHFIKATPARDHNLTEDEIRAQRRRRHRRKEKKRLERANSWETV